MGSLQHSVKTRKHGFRNILCPSSYQVAEHAKLCRGLCPNYRSDQYAGRCAVRRNAANHVGAYDRDIESHDARTIDREHYRSDFPVKRIAHFAISVARGGRNPETSLGAG